MQFQENRGAARRGRWNRVFAVSRECRTVTENGWKDQPQEKGFCRSARLMDRNKVEKEEQYSFLRNLFGFLGEKEKRKE